MNNYNIQCEHDNNDNTNDDDDDEQQSHTNNNMSNNNQHNHNNNNIVDHNSTPRSISAPVVPFPPISRFQSSVEQYQQSTQSAPVPSSNNDTQVANRIQQMSCSNRLRTIADSVNSCQPSIPSSVYRPTHSDHNNHFHLHLHNYLTSRSTTVALSSRMIATDRALESLLPSDQRLFYDPFSSILAGNDLMEKALARQKENRLRQDKIKKQLLEQQQQKQQEKQQEKETTSTGTNSGTTNDYTNDSSDNINENNNSIPNPTTTPTVSNPVTSISATGRPLSAETNPDSTPRVAIRTRYFDDFLIKITEETPELFRQLMLLGAGMDTRAYRLNCLKHVQCTVYELDQTPVLNYKNELLSQHSFTPLCPRITVGCELSSTSALPPTETTPPVELFNASRHLTSACIAPISQSIIQQATTTTTSSSSSAASSTPLSTPRPLPSSIHPGSISHWANSLLTEHRFDPDLPSVWLMEGLLMYTTEEQQLALLRSISSLSSINSLIGFSHINERALSNIQRSAASWGLLSSTFKSCLSPLFLDKMTEYGWDIIKITQLGAEDANYDRWKAPVYPIDDTQHGITLYVTAIKKRKINLPTNDSSTISTTPSASNDTHSGELQSRRSRTNSVVTTSSVVSTELPEDRTVDTSPSDQSNQDNQQQQQDQDDRLSRERLIEIWDNRALEYKKLTENYTIFKELANKLIELLPINQSSSSSFLLPLRIIDLACGNGIISECLLSRFPLSKIHLVDPAMKMLNIARKNIIDKFTDEALASTDMIRAENLNVLSTEFNYIPVNAILCSASMHLIKEKNIFKHLNQLIKPGGAFIYNLWGHSFNQTIEQDQINNEKWKKCVNDALMEDNFEPIYNLNESTHQSSKYIRSKDDINKTAVEFGLQLDQCIIDTLQINGDFFISFAAMNPEWLLIECGDKQSSVITRARELAQLVTVDVISVRIRIIKPATRT